MATSTRQYDVVILAGYAQEPTPLSLETGGGPKALVRIAGRPMLSYVVDALRDSGYMRSLVLVGLSASDIPDLGLDVPLACFPNHASIAQNLLAAVNALGNVERALFCSTDLPLLTPGAVRDFVARCEATGAEVCYPVVRREVMEERFPASGRSFRRLVDGAFAGGDMFLVRPAVIQANMALIKTLTDERKSAWGLVRAMGPGILLRFLARRLRIEHLERRASRLFGCSCKGIVSPCAELAMDVDEPRHLQTVLKAINQGQV